MHKKNDNPFSGKFSSNCLLKHVATYQETQEFAVIAGFFLLSDIYINFFFRKANLRKANGKS